MFTHSAQPIPVVQLQTNQFIIVGWHQRVKQTLAVKNRSPHIRKPFLSTLQKITGKMLLQYLIKQQHLNVKRFESIKCTLTFDFQQSGIVQMIHININFILTL